MSCSDGTRVSHFFCENSSHVEIGPPKYGIRPDYCGILMYFGLLKLVKASKLPGKVDNSFGPRNRTLEIENHQTHWAFKVRPIPHLLFNIATFDKSYG